MYINKSNTLNMYLIFQVLMTTQVVENVAYYESDNMWIGPREVIYISLCTEKSIKLHLMP